MVYRVALSKCRTIKTDCPYAVSIGLSEDKQSLEVKKISDLHNHDLDEVKLQIELCTL